MDEFDTILMGSAISLPQDGIVFPALRLGRVEVDYLSRLRAGDYSIEVGIFAALMFAFLLLSDTLHAALLLILLLLFAQLFSAAFFHRYPSRASATRSLSA